MRLSHYATALIYILAFTANVFAQTDKLDLYNRWDIRGSYYATGGTLTVADSDGMTALSLLPERTVSVIAGPETYPEDASLFRAYLYWSASLEAPDTSVLLTLQGGNSQTVEALSLIHI